MSTPIIPPISDKLINRLSTLVREFPSQTAAANASSVNVSTLKRWLAGDSEPGFFSILRLASAAGVSLDWMMLGEGPMRLDDRERVEGLSPVMVRDAARFVFGAWQAFPDLPPDDVAEAVARRAAELTTIAERRNLDPE